MHSVAIGRFYLQILLFSTVLLLSACGGSGGDTAEPSTVPPVIPPADPTPVNVPQTVGEQERTDAARLLTQATFGPTNEQIEVVAEYLLDNSVEQWVDEQAAIPATLHYPVARVLRQGQEDLPGAFGRPHRMDAWWRASLLGEDQLRQRVAFALSQLFVISENSQLENFQVELANWYDLLLSHSFGNYRDLMEATTKSPVMGLYLSMMSNEKPQPELNIRPDENFARELMQLFTIGLFELNIDGSIKRDAQNNPIPAYNQALIEAYAHVFTGWHFAGKTERTWDAFFVGLDFINPMEVLDIYHDEGQKQLLNNVTVPAGTPAEVALDMALDSLFDHPNVGPFVAQHMIQHLVTSNPSPSYVARVANVFNNNGQNVRGDMLAVVKAVLNDDEARSDTFYTQATYGRVKQPLVRATQILRAIMPNNTLGELALDNDDNAFRELARIQEFTAQAPLGAPSVFNFFLPDHQVNGELATLGMVAPEFQMITSNNLIGNNNLVAYFLHASDTERMRERLGIDFDQYEALLIDNRETFLKAINYTLLQGQMSEDFSQVLQDYDNQLLSANTSSSTPEMRVKELLNLVLTSPQFAVQQ